MVLVLGEEGRELLLGGGLFVLGRRGLFAVPSLEAGSSGDRLVRRLLVVLLVLVLVLGGWVFVVLEEVDDLLHFDHLGMGGCLFALGMRDWLVVGFVGMGCWFGMVGFGLESPIGVLVVVVVVVELGPSRLLVVLVVGRCRFDFRLPTIEALDWLLRWLRRRREGRRRGRWKAQRVTRSRMSQYMVSNESFESVLTFSSNILKEWPMAYCDH